MDSKNGLNFEGNQEDFSALLEESMASVKGLRKGQSIQARVVQVGQEWIFLDMGGKFEGMLDPKEFSGEDPPRNVEPGELLTVYYLGPFQGGHLFTTKVSTPEIARNFLREAFQGRVPLDGIVEKEVKGGYQIRLPGGVRGFCPFSQADLKRLSEPGSLVGQKLSFLLVEYHEGENRVILSRRALLEQEERQRRESLKSQLKVGMVVRGRVVAVKEFGAFVDIGGVQGLLPVSEMGWERKNDPHRFSLGEEMEVSILELDWERGRITLSLKDILPDPWREVPEKYPEGTILRGTVKHMEPFGAFVALAPGIEGLIHVSNMDVGRKIRHPKDILSVGQRVLVKVESLDMERRRLSLSLLATEEEVEVDSGQWPTDHSTAASKAPTLGDLIKERIKATRRP